MRQGNLPRRGMNYDKISDRLKQTNQRLMEYEKTNSAKAEGSKRQEDVNRQLSEFIAKNPGLDPRSLPEEIIGAWKKRSTAWRGCREVSG